MSKKMKDIGIATAMITQSNFQPLYRFIMILNDIDIIPKLILLHNKDLIIDFSPLKLKMHTIESYLGPNLFLKIINYLFSQIIMSIYIIRMFNNKQWIFYLSELSFIPIIIAKILGKRILILVGGSFQNEMKIKNYPFFVRKISNIFFELDFKLADSILVYSPSLISFWGFDKFRKKIKIIHRHFLNFEKFNIKNEYDERCDVVGYVGRLSPEKGCENLLEAIIKMKKYNLQFLIIGSGDLRDYMENKIYENEMSGKVEFIDWVPHDVLPKYLNKLKLLVLPSYTEGLPNILIESMACGTPVIATPVGAIPDIIKDKYNGFIIKDNSPNLIKEALIEIIKRTDLSKISYNCKKYVENEFVYDAILKNWRNLLGD